MSVSQANGGTRSGLLWEVERILTELKEKPQILLMENVPQVVGKGAIDDFVKWREKLESLGYSNYVEIIDASKMGIPQHRERCFMISILGDYAYSFPLTIPLKYKLKDMLDSQVDKKYYLSDKMIDGMIHTSFHQYQLKNRLQNGKECIDCITTRTAKMR